MRKKIMPDISMCNDYSCPQFEQCYRAQAKPSEYRQSYFRDSPRDKDGCNYFWPLEDTIDNKKASTAYDRGGFKDTT